MKRSTSSAAVSPTSSAAVSPSTMKRPASNQMMTPAGSQSKKTKIGQKQVFHIPNDCLARRLGRIEDNCISVGLAGGPGRNGCGK